MHSQGRAAHSPSYSVRAAVLVLILATVFWGCGFTWAKAAGAAINAACRLPDGAAIGPIWVLAMRFFAGGIVWLIVFPKARRNWTRQDVVRSVILGSVLSLGMIVQHLGLDRTSEAVSAFLTSLTILFVPLMMTFVLRRPPRGAIWIGVVLATIGVWLMTGAAPTGFGAGEMLGLACAIVYAVDIIILNYLIAPETTSKLTAGQFLVVGLATLVTCLFLPAGPWALASTHRLLALPNVGLNVLLLLIFPTLAAFGLQFRFQPRIDPSRAALIYLMEPIFASLFALAMTGRGLSAIAVAGGALIVCANGIVEALSSKAATVSAPVS
ncbi:MAG TPA: DMT family transporter [Tepidisphaeraceae bacterium]|jgi:drug/metabolite transporter (DMT)-like permease